MKVVAMVGVVEGEVVGGGAGAVGAVARVVGEAVQVSQVLQMTRARRFHGRGRRLIRARARIIIAKLSEGRRWRAQVSQLAEEVGLVGRDGGTCGGCDDCSLVHPAARIRYELSDIH